MRPHTAGPSSQDGRLAASFAILAGLAFAAFPLLRPWGDKEADGDGTVNTEAMAEAFADPLWVISHVSGMAGWALLAAAVIAAHTVHLSTKLLFTLGIAALLPFYGAETFGLHILGAAAQERDDLTLVTLEGSLRAEPTALALFGTGLLVAAVATILLARDTWASASIRWTGLPLAVLIALYLPQFFAPENLRITHGIMLGAACALWGIRQASDTRIDSNPTAG
ncbi:hypothetical protein [Nesterenkonia rhizosphaerae]|uniref:DUF4386 family protein n=1 Tax=Nesterenkonia rhizosphaerae TaxID=1348272 RepID=A0ABP9FWL2_9MICC